MATVLCEQRRVALVSVCLERRKQCLRESTQRLRRARGAFERRWWQRRVERSKMAVDRLQRLMLPREDRK